VDTHLLATGRAEPELQHVMTFEGVILFAVNVFVVTLHSFVVVGSLHQKTAGGSIDVFAPTHFITCHS